MNAFINRESKVKQKYISVKIPISTKETSWKVAESLVLLLQGRGARCTSASKQDLIQPEALCAADKDAGVSGVLMLRRKALCLTTLLPHALKR